MGVAAMVADSAHQHTGSNAGPAEPGRFEGRFYSRKQAEHYRDRFKKGRRVRTDRLEKDVLRELGARIGRIAVALDLPGGTGRLSGTLLEFADTVILADRSLAMLCVAKEDRADPRIKFELLDAEDIALADGSVDLVFCHRFLQHVLDAPRRARILSELARISRRYVILSYYPPSFLSRWRAFRRRLLGRAAPADSQPSVERYCEEIRAAGLRLVHTATMRHFPVTGTFYLFERSDVASRAPVSSPPG